MAVKLEDLFEAYYFVAGSPYEDHLAFINKETGEILFWSRDLEWMGQDPPEGIGHPDELGPEYLRVPGPRDLDLGAPLVRRFVETTLPDAAETVDAFFRRRGAYRRFKEFLSERGLLNAWHEFEDRAAREALRAWCEEMGIEVEEG